MEVVCADGVDGHEVRATILRTKNAERLDLTAVWNTLWAASVSIADAEDDEAVLEDARLALDAHDRSVAVVDREVVAQASRQRP